NPTGQPSLELKLWHESTVSEAGHSRQLSFAMTAKAMGQEALGLSRLAPNERIQCTGFVAPRFAARSQDSALAQRPGGLVFHITDYRTEN
ncbi:MAG: hypothetical protein NWS77_02000, partial [Burkholderiaceae bacterium]|nr:hypothetical protein [Burkholderiaceae bacterium]